jgi:hypothetical protein
MVVHGETSIGYETVPVNVGVAGVRFRNHTGLAATCAVTEIARSRTG